MSRRVLLPSEYQLFVWDFPGLSRTERAAALDFKLRAAIPVPPDRYRTLPTWFQHGRGWRAVVTVLRETGTAPAASSEDLALPFPFRIPGGRDETRVYETPGQAVAVVYRGGLVESVTSAVGGTGSPGTRHVGRPHGLAVGKEYRRNLAPWVVGFGVLALAGTTAGVVNQTWQREQQLQEWKAWVARESSTSAPPAPTEDLRARVGFPLLRVTAALARAWDDRIQIQGLVTKGRVLTVEAVGPSALAAAAALQNVEGLERVRLTKTRLVEGHELFTLEGEVTFDP